MVTSQRTAVVALDVSVDPTGLSRVQPSMGGVHIKYIHKCHVGAQAPIVIKTGLFFNTIPGTLARIRCIFAENVYISDSSIVEADDEGNIYGNLVVSVNRAINPNDCISFHWDFFEPS